MEWRTRNTALVFIALSLSACASKGGTSDTVTAPSPATGRVLTFTAETTTPVGQAVAITLASRDQEAGKVTLAVSGFNLMNALSPTTSGVSGVSGRIAWDPALLEPDALDAGDWMKQGGVAASCCRIPDEEAIVGSYPFLVVRPGDSRITGSGEIFLIRLRPVAGVTSGTTTVKFVPWLANKGGLAFMTTVLLSPFSPSRGSTVENTYGGTVTIR